MKTLLLLALLGVGAWYFKKHMKNNKAVKQITQAPEKYVKTLQDDVSKAKAAADSAGKAIKAQEQQAEKALDAAQ